MSKTIGIIAEYNPLHNGHYALVNLAKQNGYSSCIAVMSGNFVQRCTPAITEKRIRTRAAVACGIDAVIELPLPYATASAHFFALGAVATLKATASVDGLCFGSETGEVAPLKLIADILEGEDYKAVLTKELASGVTFAKARTDAVGAVLGVEYAQIAKSPNNLLAIEYLLAIKKLNWQVETITFKRLAVDHHSKKPSESFASASFLRTHAGKLDEIKPYVPPEALRIYKNAQECGLYPSDFNRLEVAILSYLRRLSVNELRLLPDISEGIENRLYNAIQSATTIEELYIGIKSKRYTLSRVRRLVLTAFLGINAHHISTPPPYIRLLGAAKGSANLLKKVSTNCKLPFSHSLKLLSDSSPTASVFAKLEAGSTDQYMLSLPNISKTGYDFYEPAVFFK